MSITPVPISMRFVRAPTAASRGNGDASWRQRLGETQAQLLPLVAALATHFAAGHASDTAPAESGRALDPALLETLAQQIDSFDSQAAETAALLRDPGGSPSPAELDALDEALADFDFERAGACLAALRRRLAQHPPE